MWSRLHRRILISRGHNLSCEINYSLLEISCLGSRRWSMWRSISGSRLAVETLLSKILLGLKILQEWGWITTQSEQFYCDFKRAMNGITTLQSIEIFMDCLLKSILKDLRTGRRIQEETRDSRLREARLPLEQRHVVIFSLSGTRSLNC